MRSVKRYFLFISKKVFLRNCYSKSQERKERTKEKRESFFQNLKRLKRIKKHIYARFFTVTVTVTVTVRVTVRVTVTVTKYRFWRFALYKKKDRIFDV